jgi:TatD DNase family protein
MMLVDSHCHLDRLDLTAYGGDIDLALMAAYSQDVKHVLCVGIDSHNSLEVIKIAEKYSRVSAAVGVHPTEQEVEEVTISKLVQWAMHPKVVAIGETGLDYYRVEGNLEWQRERFRCHIRAALEVQKPLIIHSRQAREDTIAILQQEHAERVRGVLHCFTESWEMAQQAIAMGFYISFSGIVTFQNAKELQDVAKRVPLERILIETDSPYLAPVPYRGKSNEPAYVRYVAEKIADLRGETLDTIATVTTRNFFDLFQCADRSLYAAEFAL